MVLLRLYFSRQAAYDTVDELGELGLCEFRDLNSNQSSFQRTFSENVRRCDDMMRVVRFLSEQVAAVADLSLAPSAPDRAAMVRLDDLDSHLRSLEVELLEMNANADALQTQYNELVELSRVLDKGAEFFHTAPQPQSSGAMANPALMPGFFDGMAALSASPTIVVTNELSSGSFAEAQLPKLLSFFTGTISREKIAAFERVLFRATHGNCIVRFSELKEHLVDPATRLPVHKSVFMVFFSGKAIRAKVAKICDAFDANRYSIPEDSARQMAACKECRGRLEDLDSIMASSRAQSREILLDVANNLRTWREKIVRDTGVFHTLNLLNYDMSNQLFLAEVWCPESAQEDLRNALEIGRRRSNSQTPSLLEQKPLEHDDVPPTYYKTNRFTEVFQSIVESYGVATYQEVNPAPYAVITFPFLFAVMFGDIGHGMLMASFALYVVLNEKRIGARGSRLNEFMKMVYQGRYLLLLMGIFSIFTGFIYNEFFAIPLDLFGSRWQFTSESAMACGIDNCDVPAKVMPPLAPYPFGFDPVWKGSTTGLVFFNSYKMKLSIILGVSQMLLGLWLSKVNARYFKNQLDLLYEFIPQMLFITSVFGYLMFLIILKWCIDYNAPSCTSDSACLAPDLKSILIQMFMSPGNLPPEMTMFRGQATVQVVLLGIALISVPWMLLPKPLILRVRHQRRRGYRTVDSDDDGEALLGGEGDTQGGDHARAKFDFSEVFVHQMIHTIEFVLGSVSNTASYLRLWALSLAHAELSDVFLEKLLYASIATGNAMIMVVCFFMWIGLTMGVLMFMESLSAFLHTLRLHWVEFQSKFYLLHGDGRKFHPFVHCSSRDDDFE